MIRRMGRGRGVVRVVLRGTEQMAWQFLVIEALMIVILMLSPREVEVMGAGDGVG